MSNAVNLAQVQALANRVEPGKPYVAPKATDNGSAAPTNDPEALAALNDLAMELAVEPPGGGVQGKGRNTKLNIVACQLGHYVPHRLSRELVETALRGACETNGVLAEDGEAVFAATFNSGLSEGLKEPRWPRASATEDMGDVLADAEVDRLARLGKVAYERERKAAAERLGISRIRVLDEAVEERRTALQQPDGAQASWKRETIPWDEPVDGARLMMELVQTIRRYLILPRFAAETMAFWVLHAHAIGATGAPGVPVFVISPYLTFTSPAPSCGKTQALKIIYRLTPRPLLVSSATGPVTFRLVNAHQPTLLLDEAETYTADDESLRGILDAAHDYESASIPRCVGDEHEVAVFRVWCPKAVGLIGKLPDTLMSRSIVVRMQRKQRHEKVDRLLATDAEAKALFDRLNRQCARWVADNLDALRECRPAPLDELADRDVDNWTPLLAIAEAIGGFWPEAARVAARQLSGARGDDEGWRGVALLRDVRRVFDERGIDKLYAAGLAQALNELPDAPWADYRNGKGLDTRSVRAMLRGYLEFRQEDRYGSFYLRSELADAWERYCP